MGSNFCLIGNRRSFLLRTMLFPPLRSRFLLGRQRSNHYLAVLTPHGCSPSAHSACYGGLPQTVTWGEVDEFEENPGLLRRTFPKAIYPPLPCGRMAPRKQLWNAVSWEAVFPGLGKELTSLHVPRAPKCSLFLFSPSDCKQVWKGTCHHIDIWA